MAFDFKDILGLGKPATKLIEVLSAGTGTWYRPRAIRNEAAAQAEAIKLLGAAETSVEAEKIVARAKATAIANVTLLEAETSIEDRIRSRQEHQALSKQSNIEAIALAAANQLPPEVSDKPVDENWRTRFFNIAEDISGEKMQQHWGKLLAGEVAEPGSYSLRTLEVFRNLSQNEALAFQRIRCLATDTGAILKLTSTTKGFEEFGIDYDAILMLRESGLLLAGDTISIAIPITSEKPYAAIPYNGKMLLFKPNVKIDELVLNILSLSTAGTELLSLIEPQPHRSYLNKLANHLSTKNCSLSLGSKEMPIDEYEKLSTRA